jgi:hypothetical protein
MKVCRGILNLVINLGALLEDVNTIFFLSPTLNLVKISLLERNCGRLLGYPWRGKHIRRTRRTMSRYTYVACLVGSYCGDAEESSFLVCCMTDSKMFAENSKYYLRRQLVFVWNCFFFRLSSWKLKVAQ